LTFIFECLGVRAMQELFRSLRGLDSKTFVGNAAYASHAAVSLVMVPLVGYHAFSFGSTVSGLSITAYLASSALFNFVDEKHV